MGREQSPMNISLTSQEATQENLKLWFPDLQSTRIIFELRKQETFGSSPKLPGWESLSTRPTSTVRDDEKKIEMFLSREPERVNFQKFSCLLEAVKSRVATLQQCGNHFVSAFCQREATSWGCCEILNNEPRVAPGTGYIWKYLQIWRFRKVNRCIFLPLPSIWSRVDCGTLFGGSAGGGEGARAVLSLEPPRRTAHCWLEN